MATDTPFLGIYLRKHLLPTTATARQHGNRMGARQMEVARMGARQTLEAARAAAIEARRTRRQLRLLDEDGGPWTPERYRASLQGRLDPCTQATDRGRAVLDAMEGAGTIGGWVLDAARMRYLDAMEWGEVAELVCYSTAHMRRMVGATLAAADADS